jgi:ABC-2 type transport system permease protein
LPARFGEQAPRALFSRRERPVIEIRYDPSQSIALQVVQGLLAQHVMEAVADSAFGSAAGGADITADARADVVNSPTMAADARKDLLALFDSVERVRRTAAAPAPAPAGADPAATGARSAFRMPYTVNETEARSSSGDAKYNGYSHSFAGMGVQFILLMGIDFGIKLLNARRMGLWQRLRAAPLSRGFLLGSQVASGALIAALLFAIIFAAGIAIFGVRIEGSVVGFLALIVAFALMTAAFGLFIAALGRTPEATRGLAVFATLVMVMLGGAWVPAFVFPQWLQTASLAVPTRWAVDGFDAMTWRGLGFEAAAMPVFVLLGYAVAFAAIAVARFDWDEK